MNHDAITKTDAFAGLQCEAAVFALIVIKIVIAKRIRGEKTVVPGVPGCRMLRILRMVENRDSDSFAIECAGIIDPRRWLAPDILHLLGAFGVRHRAGAALFGK